MEVQAPSQVEPLCQGPGSRPKSRPAQVPNPGVNIAGIPVLGSGYFIRAPGPHPGRSNCLLRMWLEDLDLSTITLGVKDH